MNEEFTLDFLNKEVMKVVKNLKETDTYWYFPLKKFILLVGRQEYKFEKPDHKIFGELVRINRYNPNSKHAEYLGTVCLERIPYEAPQYVDDWGTPEHLYLKFAKIVNNNDIECSEVIYEFYDNKKLSAGIDSFCNKLSNCLSKYL